MSGKLIDNPMKALVDGIGGPETFHLGFDGFEDVVLHEEELIDLIVLMETVLNAIKR